MFLFQFWFNLVLTSTKYKCLFLNVNENAQFWILWMIFICIMLPFEEDKIFQTNEGTFWLLPMISLMIFACFKFWFSSTSICNYSSWKTDCWISHICLRVCKWVKEGGGAYFWANSLSGVFLWTNEKDLPNMSHECMIERKMAFPDKSLSLFLSLSP